MAILRVKDGDEWKEIQAIKGEDAKINGYNTITLEEGTNIEIVQDEDELIINNTYDDSEILSDISSLETNKADKSELPTKLSELTNDSGFVTKSVNNLTYYTLKTATGSLIDLEINSSTYVITLKLKDIDGNIISSDTIDLPLESVVVGGSYDSANKKIILTLENGNTVEFSVADLVSGLQSELSSTNKLNADYIDDSNSGKKLVTTSEKNTWNDKQDLIDVSHKLSADLVDDTSTTNKFTNATEKTTWNNKLDSGDLVGYVKNTDYATTNQGGVIKVENSTGTQIYQGILLGTTRSYAAYLENNNTLFISKGTLENVITGKDLTTKAYVDGLVGDIESILEELDIGNGVD